MLKRLTVGVALAAIALAGAPTLIAQTAQDWELKANTARWDGSGPRTRPVAPRPNPRPENIPVGIVYDDGVVTALPGVTSYCWGNQFNTASGQTVKSFSVTMLSFYMASGAGSDGVFVSLYGPVSGTTAPFIEDIFIGAVVPGSFNTATIGPYAGGGSFQAGVWYVAGDSVGLGSGTVNGQGHHAMLINDIVGTDWQTVGSLNALVGASTAFIIPVELTEFSISDD